jgi:hypothetical protein
MSIFIGRVGRKSWPFHAHRIANRILDPRIDPQVFPLGRDHPASPGSKLMTNDGLARLTIMRLAKFLPLLLYVSLACFGQTAGQTQLPDTPAAHQFSEVIATLTVTSCKRVFPPERNALTSI